MRLQNFSRIVLLAASCVLVLTGCAGPKIITRQPSSSKMLQPIPRNSKLIITSTCDDGVAGSVIQDKLGQALLGTGKFAAVEYGTPTANDLQVNIEIRAKRSLWGRRAYNGDFSRVSADGEIMLGQKKLVAIHESRSGSGGLFGSGGVSSCGEARMIKALTRWTIQDVAEYVETVQVNGK